MDKGRGSEEIETQAEKDEGAGREGRRREECGDSPREFENPEDSPRDSLREFWNPQPSSAHAISFFWIQLIRAPLN